MGAILSVTDRAGANPVPGTHALHQRLGFEESGRLRECGYKFGHWLDVVEMSKILE
jgi:L-amino acid N-acyltransferase YncA